MKPRFAVLLRDMLDAANSIKLHTNGITMFSQFISNRTVLRAVERELEIIAEAMKLAKKKTLILSLKKNIRYVLLEIESFMTTQIQIMKLFGESL